MLLSKGLACLNIHCLSSSTYIQMCLSNLPIKKQKLSTSLGINHFPREISYEYYLCGLIINFKLLYKKKNKNAGLLLLKDLAKISHRGLKSRDSARSLAHIHCFSYLGLLPKGFPGCHFPSSWLVFLSLVSDETPFYVLPFRVFIAMSVVWKKQ